MLHLLHVIQMGTDYMYSHNMVTDTNQPIYMMIDRRNSYLLNSGGKSVLYL